MRDYKREAFTVLVVVLFLNCFSYAVDTEYKKVDPNAIPDKLAMLISVTKANYEKIKNWQGKMTYHGVYVYRGSVAAEHLKAASIKVTDEPNELYQIGDSTSEFKVDVKNNRFLRHINRLEPPIYADPRKDATYKSLSPPEENTEIVTSEHQISISPFRRTKDHVVEEKIARKEKSRRTERSDPREAFNVGMMPVWELLSLISQSLKSHKPGVDTYSVVLEEKTEGNIALTYRIKMTNPEKSREFFTFVLRGEVGFNPVYTESRTEDGSAVLSESTRDFVKVQDVFLPSKWNASQYYPSDGKLLREVNRTMSDMQVNVSMPDSTFSEYNYLQDGDRYIDDIKKKKYIYKGASKLVEITDANK